MNYNFDDLKEKFLSQWEKSKATYQLKRPNILVCGYTGSGKTSLIQAILGDLVPEDQIGNGAPKTMTFDHYENDLISIWDSKGLESGQTEAGFVETMRRFLRERQEDRNVDNHVHLVWYTIQGSGARVTDCDLNLIKHIFNPEAVIVAITKRDLIRPNQLEALMDRLKSAGVREDRIIATTDLQGGSVGCAELVELSTTMLPEAYKQAFIGAQQVDMQKKIDAVLAKAPLARKIIYTATGTAAGIGAIPIPLSDATLLVPTQMGMIAALAALYQLEKAMIANFALPFVAQCAGLVTVTSLSKLIPGLGSLINAGVASGLTGAMGAFVKMNFEDMQIKRIKGEPVPEFGLNFEQFQKFYHDYIKKPIADRFDEFTNPDSSKS